MRYAVPISDKERAAVLVYLNARAVGECLKNPLKCLSGMLLDNFGWPAAIGRQRSEVVIKELEQDGKVQCRYNARNVPVGVMVVKPSADVKKESLRVEPSLSQTSEPEKVAAPPPSDEPRSCGHSANRNTLHVPRKIRKKGVLRRLRKANEKGDRNEARFYILVTRFLAAVAKTFPEIVLSTKCFRSGRHNPRKGKIDVADHCGNDVRLELCLRNGIEHGEVIYQVKSSALAAERFNGSIILFPGQEAALLKKAIVVNKSFSDRDIAAEVVGDLASVGLLPHFVKEAAETLL